MAMDRFMTYVGVYSSVEDAKADFDAVHDLHAKDGLIDAYDAVVFERKGSVKVKIVKQARDADPCRWGERRNARTRDRPDRRAVPCGGNRRRPVWSPHPVAARRSVHSPGTRLPG